MKLIATILCEDLETASQIGLASRSAKGESSSFNVHQFTDSMKRWTGVWLCAAGLLALHVGITAQPVTLVEEGIPRMTLLPGTVREPVAELQRYLKNISGTELPVGAPQPGAHGVFVG